MTENSALNVRNYFPTVVNIVPKSEGEMRMKRPHLELWVLSFRPQGGMTVPQSFG
jgi:hypothetical protein